MLLCMFLFLIERDYPGPTTLCDTMSSKPEYANISSCKEEYANIPPSKAEYANIPPG